MRTCRSLVTGASGFLGSRLVKLLAERGDQVNAMVRPGSNLKRLEGLPWDRVRLVYGDIAVPHSVFAATAQCTRIYHLATNFTLSEPESERVLAPAVEGTRSVLDAAKARSINRIVVTGSAMTLGASASEDVADETHHPVFHDVDAYLSAKIAAEQLVAERVRVGAPVVMVLPTAIVGPGDARPTPTGAGILEYLRFGGGTFVPIPGGGLNVVDVDDAALGHVLAMERGVDGERYVLGGENITFAQMFSMLSDIAGLPPPHLQVPRVLMAVGVGLMEWAARRSGSSISVTRRMVRDFVGRYAWVTSAKAEQRLGYFHRPARNGLERSVRWYADHGYFDEKLERRVRVHLL